MQSIVYCGDIHPVNDVYMLGPSTIYPFSDRVRLDFVFVMILVSSPFAHHLFPHLLFLTYDPLSCLVLSLVSFFLLLFQLTNMFTDIFMRFFSGVSNTSLVRILPKTCPISRWAARGSRSEAPSSPVTDSSLELRSRGSASSRRTISPRLYSLRIRLTASSDPWCKFFAWRRSKSLRENGREHIPQVKGFNLLWVDKVCLVRCSSRVKARWHWSQLNIRGLPSGVLVP